MKGYLCWAFHCVSYLLSPIVVVQSLSHVWLFVTPWTAAWQASLSFTISWSFLQLISIESMTPSSHLILCHPLLLLPSIHIRVFFNESAHHIRRPEYWSFSFSISPSNGYSRLLSFRIDWFDSLQSRDLWCSPAPQFEGINIWRSAFFTVQLSHPYMTTGKPKPWTYRPLAK